MPKKEETHVNGEACIGCRYYLAYEFMEDSPGEEEDEEESEFTGVCRRYPPQLFLIYPESMSMYPDVVGATGWCGEFTPKL